VHKLTDSKIGLAVSAQPRTPFSRRRARRASPLFARFFGAVPPHARAFECLPAARAGALRCASQRASSPGPLHSCGLRVLQANALPANRAHCFIIEHLSRLGTLVAHSSPQRAPRIDLAGRPRPVGTMRRAMRAQCAGAAAGVAARHSKRSREVPIMSRVDKTTRQGPSRRRVLKGAAAVAGAAAG